MAEGLPPEAVAEAWSDDEVEACPRCPACTSASRNLYVDNLPDRLFGSPAREWVLQRCRRCGSAYLDPRPTRETIAWAYRSYYTHSPGRSDHAEGETPRLAARARRSLQRGYLNARFGLELQPASPLGRFVVPLGLGWARRARAWARLPRPYPGARLLDVGSGSGETVSHFAALGWDALGIDVDPSAAALATSLGRRVILAELSDLPKSHPFDAIVMNHSIEHLHEPRAALENAFQLLHRGGVIEIATPNFASVGRRTYGRDWLGLDPPRHLVLFSPQGLWRALTGAGFTQLTLCRPRRVPQWYFDASEGLRSGADWTQHPPLPPVRRLALVGASLASRFAQQLAEELLVVARKP